MKAQFVYAVVILLLLIAAHATQAQTTHVVTSLDDSGSGTFRQAVADAASGDTIVFMVTGTIELQTKLEISKDLTIRGPGARLLSIKSTNGRSAIFFRNGASITLERLAFEASIGLITYLLEVEGGSTVDINDVRITGNTGDKILFVHVGGTASLTRCEVSDNDCAGKQGVITSFGSLYVSGCTFAENNTDGAVVIQAANSSFLELNSSTIVNNSSSDGDYIGSIHAYSSATVEIGNTIVAANPGSSVPSLKNEGATFLSNGYNLIANIGSSGITAETGDVFGTAGSPLFLVAPVLQFVGDSQTRVSQISDSRIVDAIPATSTSALQPDQLYRNASGNIDMGAYEYNGSFQTDMEVYAVPSYSLFIDKGLKCRFTSTASWVQHLQSMIIEYDTDSSFSSPTTVVDNNSPFSIGDQKSEVDYIDWNTTYHLRIRAVNDNADGFFSYTISFTTPDEPALEVESGGATIGNGDNSPSGVDNTDFGAARYGTILSSRFSLVNYGSQVLNISQIELPEGFSFESVVPGTVSADGGSEFIDVGFNPSAPGTYEGQIKIHSDDPDDSVYEFKITATATYSSIALTGNGNSVANDSTTTSTSNNTDFDHFKTGGSVTKAFEIVNAGDVASAIDVALSNQSHNTFSIITEPSSVSASGSETLEIRCSSSDVGTNTATVTVTSQDWQDTTYTFPISADVFDDPVLTTDDASNITSGSAVLNARVDDDNNAPITEQGFVYSLNANPTVTDNKVVVSGVGTGPFSDTASGLATDTRYYFRPYTMVEGSAVYGPEKSFTTLETFTLTIQGSGDGSGTVTSDAGGINANWDGSNLTGTTSATFDAGTEVELTATPASDSAFDGWSGDANGTTTPVSVTVDGDKTVTADFALDEFVVSGTITLNGSALQGISVGLSGDSSASTTTDANGDYRFVVITGFSGTITPVSGSYQFSPASIAVSNVTADSPGNDFTASTTYNLSGYIFFRGEPLADVKVSTGGLSAMTDRDGFYVIEVDTDFSGNLTASRDGFRFLPSQIPVGPVRSNLLNLDFRGRLIDQSAAWPTIRYFHTGNAPVDDLGSVELHWSVDNVDSVDISGVGGGLPPAGMTEVKVKGTQTFELTAENDLGSQTAIVRVDRPKAPRILWFMAEDASISNGESTVLNYGARHTGTLELRDNRISDSTELEDKTGEVTVNPAETTAYTLLARNNGKTRKKKLTVDVTDGPIIDEFRAGMLVVMPGDAVTLRWQTRKADEVEIGGLDQSLAKNGEITLSPAETTTYRLIATNAEGSTSEEVTVSVHEQSDLADLAVELEIEEAKGRPDAGSSIEVTATVTNNGAGIAENVELLFSSGGYEQYSLLMGDIASGDSKTRTREIVLLGRGRVEVEARAATATPEYHLADNSAREKVRTRRVTGVDLAVGIPGIEVTETKGVYRYNFVVFNVGSKRADDFQVDFYVSEDQPVRAAKNLVNAISIERLAPGDGIMITGLFFADADTSYLLHPVADVYDATSDQNPGNNVTTIKAN